MSWPEVLGSFGGFCVLALGVAEIGARLGEAIKAAFGPGLRHDDPASAPPPARAREDVQ